MIKNWHKQSDGSQEQTEELLREAMMFIKEEITDSSFLFDCRVIVTELISNAYKHSDREIDIDISITKRSVEISVSNKGKSLSKKQIDQMIAIEKRKDTLRESGRGLLLIHHFADRMKVKENKESVVIIASKDR